MIKKLLSFIPALLIATLILGQTAPYLSVTTTGYTEVNNIQKITSLSTGTISFWAKSDIPGSIGNILMSASNKGTANVNNYELQIAHRPENLIQIVGIINTNVTVNAWTPNNSFTNGVWHNLTVVFDGMGAVQVYIDGVSQTMTAVSPGSTNEVFFNQLPGINNIKLGALERNSIIYSKGEVTFDNFSIWSTPFNANQVTQCISNPGNYNICDLVAYYDFQKEENLSVGTAGSNDVLDKTGNNVNLDLVNSSIVNPVSTIDNTAILSPTKFIEVHNFSSITSLTEGTISLWVKINDLSKSSFLFTATNSGESLLDANEFYFDYYNSLHRIQVGGSKNGSVVLDAFTPEYSIADNDWHNITVVSGSVSSKIQVYIDGVAQTLTAGTCCGGTTDNFFLNDISGIDNIKIGALHRSNADFYSDNIEIDDFRIWDYPLTANEILSAMKSESFSQDCNLVAYYNFNTLEDLETGETGVNDYKDITGNNVNGDYVTVVPPVANSIVKNKNSNIQLLNNIAVDFLSIQLTNSTSPKLDVLITDLNGKILINNSVLTSGTNGRIDVSSLSNGFYLLKLSNNDSVGEFKFLKAQR